jgi:hypothetical protein
MANIVSILMENPKKDSVAKVPRSTTGTAIVGINVARIFPMKSHIIRNTSSIASRRVITTSFIATLTKGVVS